MKNKKKFYILLEDDWELRGNGVGNVRELQHIPSLFLMDLCEKLNIKMTFMVDVAQQLKFIEYQEHPEIKSQKELWDETVRLMKQRGFDVQLHLHPQWLNAQYHDKNFYVSDNWNIGTYDEASRKKLIDDSIKYLNDLLKPIDSEYIVNSFKSGAWGLQPSGGILNDLYNKGIKLVIAVRKGLLMPNLGVDYRMLEEDTLPYYPVFKDITKVAQENTGVISFPLLYYMPTLKTLMKLFIHKLKKKIFNKTNAKEKIPESIKKIKPFGKLNFEILYKSYITHLKIGDQPFGYLKDSFDNAIKRLEKHNIENIAIVIESHTKDYIDNYDDIEKFLIYIVKKYNGRVEFIDLTTFIKSVDNDKFFVKSKMEEFNQNYSKFKVLMIGPDIEAQGGIASVIKLYKDYNLDVSNILTYKEGGFFSKIIVYCLFLIKYIFTLLFDRAIKLVHIHTSSRGSFFRKYIIFYISKFFNKKVIINIHPMHFVQFYENSNIIVKKMITGVLNRCDLILVLSEKIKQKIADICQNKSIEVLYNPVVIKDINSKESNQINILFLGKLCQLKGVYDIIESAKYITNSNIIINLYGDGNLEEFKNLINNSNVQSKVKIKGWISGEDKERAYQNSDIVILPSYTEGLPMSILEAMAYGLPVISTPVGGIAEAVEDNVNGYLIEPGDYKALAEKIDSLANDKNLREKMGQEGYRIAKEKFDVRVIVKQLQGIYGELLK